MDLFDQEKAILEQELLEGLIVAEEQLLSKAAAKFREIGQCKAMTIIGNRCRQHFYYSNYGYRKELNYSIWSPSNWKCNVHNKNNKNLSPENIGPWYAFDEGEIIKGNIRKKTASERFGSGSVQCIAKTSMNERCKNSWFSSRLNEQIPFIPWLPIDYRCHLHAENKSSIHYGLWEHASRNYILAPEIIDKH
ncbi:MAG: hypothetical protein ACOH5I_25870 [Oligoflexus sp.]